METQKIFGRGVEIRTPGLLRPRQARYQAALRPDMKCFVDSKALTNYEATPNQPIWPTTVPKLCQNDFTESSLCQNPMSFHWPDG
jgi:hypothetical protein